MIQKEFETEDVVGYVLQLGRPTYRIKVARFSGYVSPLWVGQRIKVKVIRYIEGNEEYLTEIECEIVGYEQENNAQYIHAREI